MHSAIWQCCPYFSLERTKAALVMAYKAQVRKAAVLPAYLDKIGLVGCLTVFGTSHEGMQISTEMELLTIKSYYPSIMIAYY